MCVCLKIGGLPHLWKFTLPMTITVIILIWLIMIDPSLLTEDAPCPDGKLCLANWTCCKQGGCCPPTTAHPRSSDILRDQGFMDQPWYTQWPVLFFLGILGGILICCLWFCFCKRYTSDGVLAISCACCMRPLHTSDEIDSAGSLYPPPHYSRCGSIHQAPPPYSEVQSKPDLYPLVITCADGEGKAGGNYVMVQYFQNYVIRPPPGSLSATSTADSLNSSYICNATNDANTIIPPPYSCSNLEEYSVERAVLRSMSSLMEPPASTPVPSTRPEEFAIHTPLRQQRFTTNVTENMLNDSVERLDLTRTPSYLEVFECPDMYCTHGCEPKPQNISYQPHQPSNADPPYEECDTQQPLKSPSSPTHPSQETIKKQSDERKQRRLTESLKWNSRKSSLYMPLLSTAYPARPSRVSLGSRAFSMSAPATPCSNLVPNILNLTQRVSASKHSSRSSRLEEEYDPLLSDVEQARTDDKF